MAKVESASDLVRVWDESFVAEEHRHVQRVNRPSQAGITCARRLWYHRTSNTDGSMADVGLLRRFRLGHVHEKEVAQRLEAAGVRLTQRQRDQEWREFQLAGSIDGIVTLDSGERVVVDFKSADPNALRSLRGTYDAASLLDSPKDYLRGYVAQLAVYLFLLEIHRGWLIFLDKSSWAMHIMETTLDDPRVLDAAERALKRWERVNAAIAAGDEVEREPGAHCVRCPFVSICEPKIDLAATIALVLDDDVEDVLRIRDETAEAAKRHRDADDRVKEIFAAPGTFVVGPFVVEVKAGETTTYDIPPATKKQYAKKVPQLRRKIERKSVGGPGNEPPAD